VAIQTKNNISKFIDHTNLKPDATRDDIAKLVKEAQDYGFNSVCIRPQWLKEFSTEYKTSAVIDFPKDIISIANFDDLDIAKQIIGNSSLEDKIFSATEAIKDGAKELDPVIRIGELSNIESELRAYIELLDNQDEELWLKPIFSCELLKLEEINFTIEAFTREVSRHFSINPNSKLKFAYKNSTGFIKQSIEEIASSPSAPRNEDYAVIATASEAKQEAIHLHTTSVELINFIADKLDMNDPYRYLHIKAAGGVRDLSTAQKIICAAKDRLSHIGTSAGIDICHTSPPRRSVTVKNP
jgi:deoxyribose-phosphate aldolase